MLEAHGLDAAAEIREFGCDPTLFTHLKNTIDFAVVGRLPTTQPAVNIAKPVVKLDRLPGEAA